MHLIVAHARWPHGSPRELHDPRDPRPPAPPQVPWPPRHLEQIGTQWSCVDQGEPLSAGPDAMVGAAAHEQAYARAVGAWSEASKPVPWAALLARRHFAHAASSDASIAATNAASIAAPNATSAGAADARIAALSHPCGLLLPVHWRVALDHVELVGDAKLGVSSDEAHAIWQAVEPLLHDDGFTGFRVGEHWMLAHDDFALTHTSSIDRACGHAVEDHRPHGPAASRWGRLQNEIQMLLHNHPVNDARDERGLLPINSLWLSGTGRLDPAVAAPSDDVHLELRLREPALRGDLGAWLEAWQTIDRERVAPLMNEPAARLTLCSIDRAPTLAPRRLAWWQRWRKPAAVNLDTLWTPA